ncbi:MAG: HAD-IA family hydrolase [Pseudomonadota bacterium]
MACIVFDLDGTLADTSADLIAAANHCFELRGLGPLLDPVADALVAFHGGRAMLNAGLKRHFGAADAAMVEDDYPKLLDFYGRNIDVHTVLYPGVEAALDRLNSAGHTLGVCTNKPEALAEVLLTRLGLRDLFAAMLGADTLPVRKPDPEHLWQTIDRCGGRRDDAVLIGDTITDRGAAQNAGVPCVLVTFGPEGEGVRAMEPEGLLPHYDQIETVLAQVL